MQSFYFVNLLKAKAIYNVSSESKAKDKLKSKCFPTRLQQ